MCGPRVPEVTRGRCAVGQPASGSGTVHEMKLPIAKAIDASRQCHGQWVDHPRGIGVSPVNRARQKATQNTLNSTAPQRTEVQFRGAESVRRYTILRKGGRSSSDRPMATGPQVVHTQPAVKMSIV